jgi:fatty acid desaturase
MSESCEVADARAQEIREMLGRIDVEGWAEELNALRDRTVQDLNEEDLRHLRRVERNGRIATLLGYALAWPFVNPIAAFLISFGAVTRWMMAHHVMHRGYDKVPNVPSRFTSKHFARGKRRFIDWFDWIYPEAWEHEHNVLHHYNTGGEADPDLVERHLEFLRRSNMRKPLKYLYMFLLGISWKFSYYAPNTLSVIYPEKGTARTYKHIAFITYRSILKFKNECVQKLWSRCYLPYGLIQFVVFPLLFLPLGKGAVLNVLLTRILAEFFTNFHTFLVIGPNHSGEDVCRFNFHFRDKNEFYLTQVLGTANYRTGGYWNDHMHKWLNYQIEHHLFPDIPLRRYEMIQPEVKRICEKYGVPYLQESVFVRFWKMIDMCVGNTSMIRLDSFESGADPKARATREEAHASV